MLLRTSLSCAAATGTVLAALGGSPAPAQTASSTATPVELEPLTVEGQVGGKGKGEGNVSGKPAVLTTTTTRQQLDDQQIDSLADYARRIDAGLSYGTGNRSVNIQGLDKNRVLTTLDDIRIPWMYDGARGVQGGVSAFDFDTIARVDVVKSTDSSFFGAGALGGMLALRTIDPEEVLRTGKMFGGISRISYDSADRSWYGQQTLAARANNTFFLFQGGYKKGHETENQGDIGGTGTTRTEKNPSDYDQNNYLVKLHHYVDGGHRLAVTAESYRREETIDTLTSVSSTYKTYSTQEILKRKRVSAAYDYKAPASGNWLDTAHLLLYWQQVNLETGTYAYRLTTPVGTYNRDSNLKEISYGVKGSAAKEYDLGWARHLIAVGGEVYATRTSQYAAGEDNCTSAIRACSYYHVNQSDMPDVEGTTVGLYAQDRIALLDGVVRLTPGLRFDWYEQNPKETATYTANDAYEGTPASSSGSKLSPKLLAEWDIAPKVTLYAQWAQAFRAPTATELYLTYGGSGSYVSIGNPDLKPETSNGYTVGVKLGDDQLGGNVRGYYNRYENFIDTVTLTAAEAGLSGSYPYGVFKYINRANVEIYGGEVSAHWRFMPGWLARTSIAYTVGKDLDEDVHLNSIPPLKAIVGLGYATKIWGADATVTMAAARNQVEDPTSDTNKTPAYTIVDLTAWWEPELLKGWRLQAGVFNLFDATYYNALDIPDSQQLAKAYYTQPGRTFKASAIFRF
ncbi:TonB-dependent hemoglobin/transferrin/lactoferrin family receptor [Rhodoplanes sp. TEM]|uniref:TonB-dependent hemoglobin/transferrin/lactoferrin family receptor n=1 Tax=Rhodoplanes tepidamans TaxID=200616 RepID=A0ABT5JHN6_RHOTP|nr:MULTISPECIES: TonB-dependent hemoglobin/transferrin/lactoferrin family receptor [Rhodoplanes]MDC7789037.1 TonB-dependent hemoglobin/transferrin/lactoferrin family receptor [Rhodoplanes tepidamans]MDC7985948.1 TonB-dependent hemoglobin/transferrin/lactoferrin family receptor [Rhodoplanes sp. TEM]MDQ0355253.1 hemoglobin/transferrin/lactoferrin receptor protein [Rhodoplanes tepidamans]